MAILGLWLAALATLTVVGALLGWLAFFRGRSLAAQIDRLQGELESLRAGSSSAPQGDELARHDTSAGPADGDPGDLDPEILTADMSATTSAPPPPNLFPAPATPEIEHPVTPGRRHAWLRHLVDHWMVWLGGLCVGMAGIFMVRYGIEAGLLGPGARVMMAGVTGIALHGVAEWLRRRAGSDPSFAALAGGASITLYGALLAALHLYHLVDPRLAFALLAVVSLATMVLALVHGPFLAGIGILGAFAVPILVASDSGNIAAALGYSLVVSAAGLALLRFVYRPWLWWGLLAGGIGWWFISLSSAQGDGLRGLYLAALAWGFAAIPAFDGWPRRGDAGGPGGHRAMLAGRSWRLDQLTLSMLALAWGWSILDQGFMAGAFAEWAPLVVVMAFAARRRDWLIALPWLSLAVQWLAWLGTVLHFDHVAALWRLEALPAGLQPVFLGFASAMAVMYSGLALLHLRARGFSHHWLSLACLAPLAWLALAYLMVSEMHRSLNWALLALLAGLLYGAAAGLRLRKGAGETAIWFVVAAHLAYSLAAVIWLREAGLTLALAVQLATLVWLKERHQLPWMGAIVKGVLALVVIRLTLNPWLASYASDSHWSLWTGGGVTLLCFLAARLSAADPRLRGWLEAAALLLLILTLGAEVRYWLYGGDLFVERYSFAEAAINASLWTAMSLGYWAWAARAGQLTALYRGCAHLLLAMGVFSYLLVVTLLNPLWSGEPVASRPLANILLLAYGLPVVMALLVARFHDHRYRTLAQGVAGVGFLLFVSMEIRHLWQGALDLGLPTGYGELYTYSAAWLLLAGAAIAAGGLWRRRGLYRAGMALLGVVIAKIFLVDMSGLDGLLRVASFMGLGLGLLALAWLHRRLGGAPA